MSKWCCVVPYTWQVSLLLVTVAFCSAALAEESSPEWRSYTVPEWGFKVDLPASIQEKPMPAIPGSRQSAYQAEESTPLAASYTIFVGQRLEDGLLSPGSMDAFLTTSLRTQMAARNGGKLISDRTPFLGLPALRYRFEFDNGGRPYVARGITFMVDGGHMRLSMLHPSNDAEADGKWGKFSGTFMLIPLQYVAADRVVTPGMGVSFAPPAYWTKESTLNAQEIARYRNLTRFINVMRSHSPAYTCESYETELRRALGAIEAAPLNLNGRLARRVFYRQEVPGRNVTLAVVSYCFDSRSGAVVLGGAEEEKMFSRWERVFEGTARSVKIQ